MSSRYRADELTEKLTKVSISLFIEVAPELVSVMASHTAPTT